MEYVQFGRTGVRVSPLCLGCMNFGAATEEKDAIRIIHKAIDQGINFLDTANVYTRGVSEEITGKAIKDRRDRVFLATKVHGRMGDGPNERGNSRRHIMEQVDESLRRLQTDYIDLYQIHRPEAETPIDETLLALDILVRMGKVNYIGTSTFPAWQIVEAEWIADRKNGVRFDCEQPPYNVFWREVESDVLPACAKYNIAVIPWSPLAGGWLSGKYRRGTPPPEGSRMNRRGQYNEDDPETKRRLDAIEELMKLAEKKGCTLSQFALAWCLANPVVTAPIIGPRTEEQLDDNLGALGVEITEEDRKTVDALVPSGTNLAR